MSYREAIGRLAQAYAGVDAQRIEAVEWDERQVAAAEVDAARALVERIDAEVEEVWRSTVRRLGPVASRYGGPPPPAPLAPGEAYNPDQVLEGARDLLDTAWRPGQMQRSAYPLLVL